MPQIRVSDTTTMHVTLNTINNVLLFWIEKNVDNVESGFSLRRVPSYMWVLNVWFCYFGNPFKDTHMSTFKANFKAMI